MPVQVRVFNLAVKHTIRDLNPEDIDTLVSVQGMITRTSPTIPDLKCVTWRGVMPAMHREPIGSEHLHGITFMVEAPSMLVFERGVFTTDGIGLRIPARNSVCLHCVALSSFMISSWSSAAPEPRPE